MAGADGLDLSGLNQDASQEEPEYTVTYEYQEYVESWTVVVTEDVAISGHETYQGVTVYVDAPAGAFPEGTVLNIRPVVQEAAPLSFLDTITGTEAAEASAQNVAQAVADAMDVEEVDPMGMVAFDITFTDAEGNELQPADGHTVSVRFEVEAASDLVTEETSALQVYHVETDEANIPVSAQPVGQATVVEDTSADQTVEVEADSFSIYVVVQEFKPIITYNYYVQDSEGNWDCVGTQVVKSNDTLLEPEAPAPTDEGKLFLGWYTDETDGKKFDDFGPVGEVTTTDIVDLYARFGTAYYVFYTDGSGRVIYTATYAGNETVQLSAAFPSVETGADKANTGWTETAGSENIITSLSINNKDHTLYPVIKNGHWLRFDSQGGTSVDSQFVASGQTGSQPAVPDRPGYTFEGWYTAPAGGNEYRFNSLVTADTTVYAHWTPKVVNYTVIHWWENANDDEYSYHESETKQGLAGDMTNAQANSYLIQDENPVGQRVSDYPFTAKTIEQKTIAGDGSTIVNVYYVRKEYTIKFMKLTKTSSGWWGGTQKNWNTEYEEFQITAKYGEKISDQWPLHDGSSRWAVDKNDNKWQNNIDVMPLKGYTYYEPDGSGTMREVEYYVEALPGETGYNPAPQGNGKYKLHHVDRSLGSTTSTVGDEDRYPITGFTLNTRYSTRVGDNYSRASFYYDRNEYNINYYNGDSVAHKVSYLYEADIANAGEYTPDRPDSIPADYTFEGWYKDPEGTEEFIFNGKTMPAEDIIVYAKWAPVQYTVKFDLDGGEDTGDYNDQVLDPGEKVVEPIAPTKEGYQFGGWLTVEGQPYDFHQGVSRDMTLKAQWIGVGAYSVTYMRGEDNVEGEEPKDGTKYATDAEAQVLAPTGLTHPEGKVFLGWLIKGTDEIVQPGDVITVTSDMVLVAQWGEVPKKTDVVYRLMGGDYETWPAGAEKGSDATGITATVEADVNAILDVLEAPTRQGYDFAGWEKLDGTPVTGGKIQVDAYDEENNILVAQWTPRNADLNITKEVDVLGAAGQSKEPTGNTSFTIHVEVNDAAYNGTYTVGDGEPQTTTNGNIALTDGQTATISLPIGSAYTVTEVAGSELGYIYFDGEEDGTIVEGGNAVTITNKFFESVPTSVSGTKTWSGSNAPEATATITLYADTVAQSNQPSWSGDTYTFANLPRYKLVGESVVEIDYTVAETGVTVTESSLSVSKTSDGKFIVYDVTEPAKDASGAFGYKVIGHWESRKSGNDFTNVWKPADDQYQKTYGFQIAKVDEKGAAVTGVTATFTVTNKATDEKVNDFVTDPTTGIATVGGLLKGTYVIEETGAPTGYVPASGTWEITIDESGYELERVTYDESSNFFVNLWNRIFGVDANDNGDYEWEDGVLTVTNEAITGTITVSKTVVDSAGKPLDTSNKFTFDVLDADGDKKDTLEVTTSVSDTTIELPYGTYTLVESGTTIDDYNFQGVSYKVNGAEATSFTIESDGEEISVTAENTYTRKTGTLVIEKKIPAEDWSAVPDGYSGIINYAGGQTAGEVSDSKTFGKSDFERKNDYYVKTWNINVPTGNYTVTEDGSTANITDYARTISYFNGSVASNQVTVSANDPATVTVTNDYEIEKGTLTLEKNIYYDTVKSNEPTDKTFTFTVTIDSLPNGAVGNETYNAPAGTYTTAFDAQYKKYVFTLTGDDLNKDTATITNMPVGTRYTVTEDLTGKTGYTSSLPAGGEPGTMVKAGKELTVTNTYFDSKTIDLEVTKNWSNTPEEYQHAVTVALYKDNQPVAGVDPVTLNAANDWTATFEDLDLYASADSPAYVYSVMEETVNGDEAEDGRFILYNEDVEATDPTSVSQYEVIGFWTSTATKTSSATGKEVWTVTNTWKEAADDGDETSLTVLKLEKDTKEKLNGVSFTLTGDGYNSTLITGTETFEDGQVIFSGLTQGEYTLTETVPDGYTATSGANTWTITVGANGAAHNLIKVTKDTGKENVFTNIWNWIVGVTGGDNLGEDNVLTVYNTKKTGEDYDVPDTITITKVDSKNEESKLSGAKFELYKDGEKVNTTADLVTNGSGELPLTFGGTGIIPDEAEVTYTLKEVTPPAGYKVPDDEWTITVETTTEEVKEQQDGEWVFVQRTTYDATIDGDTTDSDAKTIKNEKVTAAVYGEDTITINKKDQYGAAVEGAVFALYDEDGTQVGTDITTGADGKIELKFSNELGDINPATDPKNAVTTTYVLKELKAPTGFAEVDENTAQWDVTVTVTPDEELKVVEGVQKWVTTYTYDATIDGDDVIDVENTRNNYTVTVKKIVTGETDALPDNFYISNTANAVKFTVNAQEGMQTPDSAEDGVDGSITYTWTTQFPYGTQVAFTEHNYDATEEGYSITTTPGTTSETKPVPAHNNTIVTFTNSYEKKEGADLQTPTSFQIHKIARFNDEDTEFAGVTFGLYAAEDTGFTNRITFGTTDTDGDTTINIPADALGTLEEGETKTFTLVEETQTGYESTGTWTVTATSQGFEMEFNDTTKLWDKIYSWITSIITGNDETSKFEGNTLTVINTRQTGSLTIKKAIDGDIQADEASLAEAEEQTYTFKVQAGADTKADVAGETIGGVTFDTDGVTYVTATVANPTTLTGLPTGSYTVTEVNPDYTTVTADSYEVEYYKLVMPQAATANVTDGATAKATITNTYNKDTDSSQATLTITKKIEGTLNGNDTALTAGQDMPYYFRITGTNVYGETVDEVYPVTVDANSSRGEADFTLTYSDENGYTIAEVANQSGDTLTEGNVAGIADYTWDGVNFTNGNTFAFGEDGAEVTATNTYIRDTNNLSISKTVSGGPSNVSSKVYEFTITANGVDTVSGTYGATGNYDASGNPAATVTFSGDEATVYMKAGETLTISDLPTGSYTVAEDADSAKIDAGETDWTWTPTTALNADLKTGSKTLSFINTYTRNTGALEIKKELIDSANDGNPAKAGTQEYAITVTAEESIREELSGKTYTGTKTDAVGATSSVQVAFNNGVYSTTLEANEKLTIADLPTGSYTVDEQDANIDYWAWNDPGSITKTVVKNDTVTATVQNDYTQDPTSAQATLTITKDVVDENGRPLAVTEDTTYTFTIGGTDIYGKAPKTTTAEITVAAGESDGTVEIPLIYGTYTVTETTPGNDDIQWYSFDETTYSDNADGVSLNETAKSATVAVTNHYTRDNNSLTITKQVDGIADEDTRAWAAINTTDKFEFTVEGPAIAAEKGTNGTYTATKDDKITEQVTFTASGNKATATVHITGEGTLDILDLPAGEYTVTEVESSAKIPYYLAPTVTGNNGTEVTVSKTSSGNATIINTYTQDPDVAKGAELIIQKEVRDGSTDGATITASNTYTFEITGTTVFGTEITPVQQSVSANGEATVELPKGVYQVTEINTDGEGMKIDGYTWKEEKSVISTTTDIDLTEEEGVATATFTATNVYDRDFGSLSITKEVEGLVDTDKDAQLAIDSMEYTFKVTGPADAATRYQGEDITFTLDAGDTTASGEVIITGEDTLTLTDLPAGQYTVTEVTEDKDIDLTYYNGPEVSGDNGASKRVEQTETATQFTITNTYSPKKDDVPEKVTAELTITKNIKDGDGKALNVPEGESRKYYFQITGIDVYGTLVLDLPIVELEVPAGTNTIDTAEPIDLIYGDYAVTEVDASGDSITEDNVDGFTGYTWNETESEIATAAAIHLDETNDTGSFTATNVYDRDLTDLTVTKIFKDISEADVERLENFKLTVTGPADFNGGAAKELKLSDSGVEKTYTQGKHVTYTWTLEDVPTGDYTVTENRKDAKLAEYSMTVKGSVNGSALDVLQAVDDIFSQTVDLIAHPDSTVLFQNAYTRQLGKLELTKTVVGDAEDEGKLPDGAADTKTYTFTITGPADVMNYGENGTYKNGTVVFALDEGSQTASATVTITGEGSKTIPKLPTGTYTVTEDHAGADFKYWELDVKGEGDVEVTNNGTAEITVTNTYKREVSPVEPPEELLTTLTITKVVKDSRGGDLSALAAGKNYYFRITGKDVYGDVPLTENVTVTGANSVDVDLIWGSYKVTEVDANGNPIGAGSAAEIDGYQWNKVEYTNHEDINLDKNNTAETAIATNIYEPVPMDIPVVKTWSGDYSILPNNIEVALYADGNDTGLRLTLNSGDRMDATHWLGVFESTDSDPLYRYADGGKEIVYSVVETEMNGQAITGSSIGYWDIATGRTTAGAAGLTGYDADALVLTVRNDYDLPEGDDDDDPPAPPTTPGTPSPSPSEEVNIPEDDTPLGDLPEEVPEDVEDIPDDDTPLSDLPDDPDNSDETNIFEEGVPMGDLPQTGSQSDYTPVDPTQTLGMMALAASLMAAGLLVLIGRRKDEETEQDD